LRFLLLSGSYPARVRDPTGLAIFGTDFDSPLTGKALGLRAFFVLAKGFSLSGSMPSHLGK
jgi:hypothetical protein